MGQLVDLIAVPKDWVHQSKFNIDRHRTTVLYKTVIYSFCHPTFLGLLLSGFPVEVKSQSDPDYYKLTPGTLLELGEYFQIQTTTLIFPRSLSCSGRSGRTSWATNVRDASTRP